MEPNLGDVQLVMGAAIDSILAESGPGVRTSNHLKVVEELSSHCLVAPSCKCGG